MLPELFLLQSSISYTLCFQEQTLHFNLQLQTMGNCLTTQRDSSSSLELDHLPPVRKLDPAAIEKRDHNACKKVVQAQSESLSSNNPRQVVSSLYFLEGLTSDVQFQIYSWVAIQDAAELRNYHNIMEPHKNAFPGLSALLQTNSHVAQEILYWINLRPNQSWITHRDGLIYGYPDLNTKYLLRLPKYGDGPFSQELIGEWHRFCFENPEPNSILKLVIEIDLYATGRDHNGSRNYPLRELFSEAYRMERAKKHDTPNPKVSFALYLEEVEIIYQAGSRKVAIHPADIMYDWSKMWSGINHIGCTTSRGPSFFLFPANSLRVIMKVGDKAVRCCRFDQASFSPNYALWTADDHRNFEANYSWWSCKKGKFRRNR